MQNKQPVFMFYKMVYMYNAYIYYTKNLLNTKQKLYLNIKYFTKK